jgi:cobaltochelatase CobN
VPVGWLKAEWRARRLNPRVQLSLTGCLGPCDLVNVVGILTEGPPLWLGGLTEPAHFTALLNWATAMHTAGTALPLPAALAPHRFDRFPAAWPPVAAPTTDAA